MADFSEKAASQHSSLASTEGRDKALAVLPMTRFQATRRASTFGQALAYSTHDQISWYTEVMVGVNKLKLILDTGSADTWVVAEGFQCRDVESGKSVEKEGCKFGKEFSVEEEFEPIPNRIFQLAYGDGEKLSGSFGMADITFASIPVRQQIAVVKQSSWHGDGVTSGVLGLAYPALTAAFSQPDPANNKTLIQVPYDPIITTMFSAGHIPPVFSIAISRDSTIGSYIAVGGVPPAVSAYGPWATVPIEPMDHSLIQKTPPMLEYQFYAIRVDAYLYRNATSSPLELDRWASIPHHGIELTSKLTIIDTGTTLVYLPSHEARFLALLYNPPAEWSQEEEKFLVSCTAETPSFAIQIGGEVFPIDKADLILDESREDGLCQTGFAIGGISAKEGIFGDVFLRNVLVVFDVGKGEIRLKATGYY